MFYEIRSLSVTGTPPAKTMGILLRSVPDGKYFHFKYPLSADTTIRNIIDYLHLELDCPYDNISIASHVVFKEVGINE